LGASEKNVLCGIFFFSPRKGPLGVDYRARPIGKLDIDVVSNLWGKGIIGAYPLLETCKTEMVSRHPQSAFLEALFWNPAMEAGLGSER
jgi:hypothetical protein